MKLLSILLILFLSKCGSEMTKENTTPPDPSYEIKFSPCVCKRQDLELQAKKSIMNQGVKDFEEMHSYDIEPDVESKIVDEDYDRFLYDFSLKEKPEQDENGKEELITAEGKIKQEELGRYVKETATGNRNKPFNSNPGYGSKGLEAIKAFQSGRRKRQTIDEIGKSRPIILYEIKRK